VAPALEGVKVLDLSSYIAAPYAGQLLADQGAEVVKVERPEGDPARRMPGFIVWNRGKKGITLDLKTREGQEAARRLALASDVVIENFRPGTAERYGLGYEQLRANNPRLVYCSMSAFGSKGPYRDKSGWGPLIEARAGVFAGQAGPASDPPIYTLLPFSSYFGAILAAQGIVVALYVRELTGRGQRVDVPLYNALMTAQSGGLVSFEGSKRLASGNQQGSIPDYRLYEAGDGQWLFVACGNPKFWHNLCVLLDHPEWISDPRYANVPFVFAPEDALELIATLQGILRTKPRDEWLRLLREADVPCSPVTRVDEFLDDPQVIANEMVIELEDPVMGRGRQMGFPAKLRATPGRIQGPAPLLGQHTDEVLARVGYTTEEIARLRDAGVTAAAGKER